MTTTTLERPCLSQRIKKETAAQHERMNRLVEHADPFSSRTAYARFIAAQYLYQCDVEYLFEDPVVQSTILDLDSRGRKNAALADLEDLGATVPEGDIATRGVKMPEALGWIYVSEGSTLGAAFLFKEAQSRLGLSAEFGAHFLAPYPDGRAVSWHRFVAAMDGDQVSLQQHDAVIAGAHAGFNRFGDLLHWMYPSPD